MNLTFDEAEALGLDGTGRDMDPSFPHTYAGLTDEQKVRYWQYRIMQTRQIESRFDMEMLVSKLREVAQAFGALEHAWTTIDLPGDFIVPELGLPITMAVEEASAEIWVLAEHIEAANEEVYAYVGTHRG